MFAFAHERGAALLIDEPGRGVRKAAVRIGGCLAPFGLEAERPASAEALQHVVSPRAGRDQLGLGGGYEVGSAEAEHPQDTAVIVEHESGSDQPCPGEMIHQPVGTVAIFGKVQPESTTLWRRMLNR